MNEVVLRFGAASDVGSGSVMRHLRESVMNVVARLRGGSYLAGQYAVMHSAEGFAGLTWQERIDEFTDAIPGAKELSILDFGCGPRGGLAERFGDSVIPYDPYVEAYADPPWAKDFDVVFSTDVLEHMSRREIDNFAAHVRESGAQHVYLVVATRPAAKHLPSGANAHLIVRRADWWHAYLCKRLAPSFAPVSAKADLSSQEVMLYFRRADGLPDLASESHLATLLRSRAVLTPMLVTLVLMLSWIVKAVVHHDYDLI